MPRPATPGPGALAALALAALAAACSDDTAASPGAPAPVPVEVLTIEARDVPVTAEFVGKTASSRRVEIRSRVTGFLERRVYREGELVEEGAVLFEMDKKPFEAALDATRAELAQQQSRLDNAEANLARVRPLVEQNAVARKDLDDAESEQRSAAAAVEAAKAKVVQAELDLSYTTIHSPVAGMTSFAKQQDGAYIGLGSDALLTYVAALDPMWVEFSVSENQMFRARNEERAGQVTLPADSDYEVEVVLADGSSFPHRGRITFQDASISDETGTFLIRAEIPNPDGLLRPGQFVRANLHGAVRPRAVLVPQRAVQQGAQGAFVWVARDDDTAELRPITIGPWQDDAWFVDSGLAAGERVVVDGVLRLRPGAPLRASEAAAPASDAGGEG